MKTHLILLFALFFSACLVAAGVQAFSDPALDTHTLNEHLRDMESYTRESIFIIDQYEKGNVSFAYTKTQFELINKKIVSFYQQLPTTRIPQSQKQNVRETEKLTFAFSFSLNQIISSNGEKAVLQTEKMNLTQLERKIESEVQIYE